MAQKYSVLMLLVVIGIVVLGALFINGLRKSPPGNAYGPLINPLEFTPHVTNKYFSLVPGTRLIYVGSDDGQIEIVVTNQTRQVMGVKARVVREREWEDGGLVEETFDWFAQDRQGNVWYFGEESKELDNGIMVSMEGSWEAGVDGALPGIIMKANPKVGDSYRQEYYEGIAEDMAQVAAVGLSLNTSLGFFSDCIQASEWSPLEPSLAESKYYCAGVATLVYESDESGGDSFYLVSVNQGAVPKEKAAPSETSAPSFPVSRQRQQKFDITAQQARSIAEGVIDGVVQSVGLESKFGQRAFVVEMKVGDDEVDVIIDRETGDVLDIEG